MEKTVPQPDISQRTVVAFSPLPAALAERISRVCHLIELDARDPKQHCAFAAALPQADGLIGAGLKLGAQQLAPATRLRVVSSITVGYDNYDVDYLSSRGIALTNTPDVLTETTADLAFALLLASARRIPELDAYVKAGRWHAAILPEQFGVNVFGRRLGIIGAGRIGAAIARRGHLGFGMEILYCGNSRRPALENETGARFSGLDDLLATADFVCIAAPLNSATHHLIGARELGLMQPHATLVNIARGAIVDEDALITALLAGRPGAAALDVYEREPLQQSPLFALPNVVTLPHIGSATHETRYAMAERAVHNLLAALRDDRPRDLVNPGAWRGSD